MGKFACTPLSQSSRRFVYVWTYIGRQGRQGRMTDVARAVVSCVVNQFEPIVAAQVDAMP